MATVEAEVMLPAPASDVWDLVGDFNAVPRWHPAIDDSRLEDGGTVRRVTVSGGGQTVERLLSRDDSRRRYSYAFIEGPMPVSQYRATLAVDVEQPGTSLVRWSSEFTPAGASEDEAKVAISGFLHAGLGNLQKLYE